MNTICGRASDKSHISKTCCNHGSYSHSLTHPHSTGWHTGRLAQRVVSQQKKDWLKEWCISCWLSERMMLQGVTNNRSYSRVLRDCHVQLSCNKATSLSHYDIFWEAHSIKEDNFSKHCGQYLSSNHDSAGDKVHVWICFKSCGSDVYSFILTFNYGFFIHTFESWNKGNY